MSDSLLARLIALRFGATQSETQSETIEHKAHKAETTREVQTDDSLAKRLSLLRDSKSDKKLPTIEPRRQFEQLRRDVGEEEVVICDYAELPNNKRAREITKGNRDSESDFV